MENWERKRVMSELTEGMELSNKLKEELQMEACDSRDEACAFLVDKIVSCYDNALSLLNCMDFCQNNDSITLIRGHVSDLHFSKDTLSEAAIKKRKNLARLSEVDDGFNWRKYGQKHILGTTHPRSYYRCTHRYTQGCLATKQVQRGEDDPRTFKVAHIGKHTCVVTTKQSDQNVNEEDMMIESDPNVVEPERLINSEPTTDLYFSMPSNNNVRIDQSFLASEPYLPEMISNLGSIANEDSDFLIDFDSGFNDAADYCSLLPERKIM